MIPADANISSQILDHLGLVASTVDALGIAKCIDERLPVDKAKGAKVPMGTRVSAMILNGLGFVTRKLYMFPGFLHNKPVERLLGPGLEAQDFNDDALGRCLDAIYEYGVMKLFSELAFEIGTTLNLLGRSTHMDTTTLSVYGEYEEEETSTQVAGKEKDLPSPAFGYPKNGRFDLKQMVLLLATTGPSGFPVWMQACSGNVSDKVSLHEAARRMKAFYQELKKAPDLLFVADSAAYDSCVNKAQTFLWLSRVPETHTLAKEWLSQEEGKIAWKTLENGYKICVKNATYKDVEQRWALVYSEQAFDREIKTLEKNITQEYESLTKALEGLKGHTFGCEKDAREALHQITKRMKYHRVEHVTCHDILKHKGRGRPKKDTEKKVCGVRIEATAVTDDGRIEAKRRQKGRFILATNQMDSTALKDEEVLWEYKDQSKTESGFRFIKDNEFRVGTVFLKKPERINALMMIMTLCLMVYNVAQYRLRESLKQNGETVPNQLKKPIQNPTMAWICEMFQGVSVVLIERGGMVREIVANLNAVLRQIIGHFGPQAAKIYGINLSG
ncbi:MAG: IS1634 family transposase [Alphaproteobacteria bacterium]|nr:IS1634 family transposase [Alphaproteobacteria bacterium]